MLWLVFCFELLDLFAGHLGAKEDFCAFKCGKKHTVCKRQPCPPNSKCGEKYKMFVPNNSIRQWILDIHNEFRDQVSSTDGGIINLSTGAKNMAILSYSKELEFVAQCWANNCNADGPHDKCRSTSRFEYVGQNDYTLEMIGTTWQVNYVSLKIAIQSWYDGYEHANIGVVNCFGCPGTSELHAVEHFTQLAWAETTHVGCGITIYGSGKAINWLLVCNYGTGGNVPTKPVYKDGRPPCSECKNNATCNAKYRTLCGESESFAMDTWTPPFALGGEKISGSAMAVCLLVVMAIVHL